MPLRPDLEARIRVVEAGVVEDRARGDDVARQLGELIRDGSAAIPDETFDDPSVVRHRDALTAVTERARRETNETKAREPVRRVASAYISTRPRPRSR